jgi:thioredoxin 1
MLATFPLRPSRLRRAVCAEAGHGLEIGHAMAGQNVHEFTADNFETEVLQSDLPVLVDFTATWCGPCKALAPIVAKIADEFQGKVKVGKLDIDASQTIAHKYGIRSVPTVMVFRGGAKSAQHVGLTTRDKLVQLIGV